MTMKRLTQLVPPPSRPIEKGTPQKIATIEQRLGLRLPRELWEFGMTYGSGYFWHPTTWIQVFNPFAVAYRKVITHRCSNLEELRSIDKPYPVYPVKGGLLPMGDSVDGDEVYWLTSGQPDKWKIVVLPEA